MSEEKIGFLFIVSGIVLSTVVRGTIVRYHEIHQMSDFIQVIPEEMKFRFASGTRCFEHQSSVLLRIADDTSKGLIMLKNFRSSLLAASVLMVVAVSQSHSFAQEKAPMQAPDKFKVKFETTKGDILLEVVRELAPIGVDHFHKAISEGFYDECRFFRVVPGFIVQFGINGDPAVQAKWRANSLKDDPVRASNTPGTVCYATAGPNTRTTQLFINFGNNAFLDGQGFAPFARVLEGLDVAQKLNDEYGESPDQGQIQSKGNEYLNASFPNLDYIKKATIVTE